MLLIMKGQMNFFIKAILIVISVLAFTSIIFISQMSKVTTVEEKGSSELRMDALETLQKLINTKECLAYEYENVTQKGNLDINKILDFNNTFQGLEPRCAKAQDFDYNIEIIQFEKKFKTYKGMQIKEKECDPENSNWSIAFHGQPSIYIYCDGDLEGCCGSGELDGHFPRTLNCGGRKVTCTPYDCSKYIKSQEECEKIYEDTTKMACCVRKTCNTHPWMMECYNIDPAINCTKITWHGHAWCGLTITASKEPYGVNYTADINQKSWGFAYLPISGTSSFSPHDAKKEEVVLVLPITIRYNETTMREGEIKITAVRGELETISSLIEDICAKAEKNPSETLIVARDIYFTYPVLYHGGQLCMMNNCKNIDCAFPINFENITQKGMHNVELNYNSGVVSVKT